jgi:DNA-binding NarL/FixJ family response regulator
MSAVVRALDGRRVLVLEDEPFIALDVADAVAHAGGMVIGPATTVAEALALIGRADLDAAILDFNLPDGDARHVIRALRGRAIPFVLHTGAHLPLEGCEPLCVFVKPTAPETLTDAVSTMIDGIAPGAP